ncbi:MAG: hypothetical protein ACOYN4_12160 [Bacteroidales bacterium]
MKTQFLALTLLTALLSCTKEKLDTSTLNPAPSDDKLVSQVHWFMDAAQDVKDGKTYKDGEKMLLDSALYYIGNTLNYKYGFVSESFGHMIVDTADIVIPFISNESKTYLVDVLDCYNITVSKLRQHYNQIIDGRKFLIGCVVKSTDWVVGRDSITIRIIGRFGYGQPITPSSNLVGYWYERDSHNCENSVNSIGAPNVLDQEIRFAKRPAPAHGQRFVFINQNIESDAFSNPISFVNEDDDIPGDNFCDYKFYYVDAPYNGITEELCCLGYDAGHNVDEMDFYMHKMGDEFSNWLDEHDKDFVDVWTFHDNNSQYPQHNILKHYSQLFYGDKVVITNGNEIYPINIME